jgi:hypothetical protein
LDEDAFPVRYDCGRTTAAITQMGHWPIFTDDLLDLHSSFVFIVFGEPESRILVHTAQGGRLCLTGGVVASI